jgi:hypothetical protein
MLPQTISYFYRLFSQNKSCKAEMKNPVETGFVLRITLVGQVVKARYLQQATSGILDSQY